MEKQDIEKLYTKIIEGADLTHDSLLSNGYTEEEIDLLIINKIIDESQKGIYYFTKIDKFHQYGIKLLIRGWIREANLCFVKCYQMAPNSRKINLQMLLRAIKRENYEEAYEIYDNMTQSSSPKHVLDDNLYLYLLNLIKQNPKYTEKVSNFIYDDIVYPIHKSNKDENIVRKAIYQNKFLYACNLTNDILSKKITEYSLKFELIKALLSKVIDIEKENKKQLLLSAKQQQYNTIVEKLIERANYKPLNKLENYILLIAGTIVKILQTKEIPETKDFFVCDMYKALLGNNFKLAQRLNEEHLELIGVSKEEDIVHILLTAINEIIENLETKQSLKDNSLSVTSYFNEAPKQLTKLEKEIMISEELAYYIYNEKISLEEAIKKIGIKKEQSIMIRLVYIRDYYIEGKTELADKLLEEIETTETLTKTIIDFINKIKENRLKGTINNHFTKKRQI